MNQLDSASRARIVACLIEGNSLRATTRITGFNRITITKLMTDLGAACSEYMDKTFRNLKCRRIQCDEIWAFVGCKEKNASKERKAEGWGDCWTWVAIDADTKLVPSWHVGTRDAGAAWEFMNDLASRLTGRVQLTTDGHRAYLSAVEDAFGCDIDYAQLVKLYGESTGGGPERAYSPAICTGTRKIVVQGAPAFEHVSTSFVERQNLTMRMSMKRFARLSNGFSKKIENHVANLALHYMQYNFCRIHQTLRVTPAMEAGVSDHVWSLAEVIGLLE